MTFCRDSLIKSVTDLFWQHGYNNISLNQIAKEIGLNRSSLYNSFKTKEALFLECLEYYTACSPTACLKEHKKENKLGPLLYEMFDKICELRSQDTENRGCLAANVYSELGSSNSSLGIILLKRNEERKKNMVNLMIEATRNGELPKNTNAEATAHIMLAFMNGLNMFAKTGASKKQLQTMSRTFLKNMGFSH